MNWSKSFDFHVTVEITGDDASPVNEGSLERSLANALSEALAATTSGAYCISTGSPVDGYTARVLKARPARPGFDTKQLARSVSGEPG
jgi:hypothetical protein